MVTALYAVMLALCSFLYLVIYPVVVYFRDVKGIITPERT